MTGKASVSLPLLPVSGGITSARGGLGSKSMLYEKIMCRLINSRPLDILLGVINLNLLQNKPQISLCVPLGKKIMTFFPHRGLNNNVK